VAGTRPFPTMSGSPLELLEERRFGGGMVFLRYRTST
jgi:hypothetical protein